MHDIACGDITSPAKLLRPFESIRCRIFLLILTAHKLLLDYNKTNRCCAQNFSGIYGGIC